VTDARGALAGQYHAALAMLRGCVERCPEELWLDPAPTNAFWHVAYHAAFYAHLYLMPDEASFVPWEKHRAEYQFLGNVPWPPHDPPKIEKPYTRDELIEYVDHVNGLVDATLADIDLDAGSSGFPWYDLPKLDHEILAIRHVQHHAGQLADRLRDRAGEGVPWTA
jgi:hypothetical protein